MIQQILLVSFKKQLYDIADDRKIHQGKVPRLGGFAFKPSIFFTIAIILGINLAFGQRQILNEIDNSLLQLAFGYCSVLLLYMVGLADDLIGIRYRAKFIFQILCGIMLIYSNVYITDLHGILGIDKIPVWAGSLLTIFITVFIINAINLIDGIDGLASGLCSSALALYGIIFHMLGRYFFSMLAFATLGVLVSFFYYNVFGNPNKCKKIFMGDTGSLTIGFMLCFFGITLSTNKYPESIEVFNPFVLGFAPLIIPCFDVIRVFFHRIRNNKNPFLPDKNHIHHKLIAIGLRQKEAMIYIVVSSLLLSLCNIYMSAYININLLLIGDVLIWTSANVWLTKKINRSYSDQ